MEEIKLRPCAKINLYLEVLRKGDNGYHQIKTLIQPISLFDELTIKCIPSRCNKGTRQGLPPHQKAPGAFWCEGLQVNCQFEDNLPGQEHLPLPFQNIVVKAAELFFSRIGETPEIEISLVKHIPIGGGLGGGSSDAASTLTGLNQLWGYPLQDKILEQLASQLGMDVPCFLKPRPAICSGRGEIIEYKWENNKRLKFWCVLVNPRKWLSTASVYKELSFSLTNSISEDNILPFSINLYNNSNTINNIIHNIRNDLEDAAIRLCPEISDIINVLYNSGVLKSFVCGSGSTVCGLVASKKEAEEVMKKVRDDRVSKDWWIRVASTI